MKLININIDDQNNILDDEDILLVFWFEDHPRDHIYQAPQVLYPMDRI